MRADWSYPTAIRFGAGRIAELGEACRAAGISRPLLVTDTGLAALPITQTVRARLKDDGLGDAMFADVEPNPTEANLVAGLAVFREGGHDGVIAFGGGSALDLGKLIAFMSGQTRAVWEFEDVADWWTRADAGAIRPVVAVPTTAGTGSEVGRAGVLTQVETRRKKIIFHPRMLPAQAICDPELTLGLPRRITIGSGLDAFAHCLEAYCAPAFHPMSHGIALEGMRLAFAHLPRVAAEPRDLEARAGMMAAASMGAVAFQKGLGAVHALSHPIGAIYGAHHGLTNAVALPKVLRFNRAAIEPSIARAAAYLGVAGGFDGFLERVCALLVELDVPQGFRLLGVERERLDELAALAAEDPSCGGNPVPLDLAALRRLYEECF